MTNQAGDRGSAASWFTDPETGRAVSFLVRPGLDETLLYLHGLGGRKEDFLGAWEVPAFDRHTLVAFDAPACGETREASGAPPPGVDDIVHAARSLVDHLGLRGLTVVGHSMGGLAGLVFSVRNPDRVRRFVSVEGNLVPDDCSMYSRAAIGVEGLERQRDYLDALVERMSGSGVAGHDAAAAELRANVRVPAFFSYCRSIVRYSDDAPLLDELAALERPRLYVYGQESAGPRHLPRLAEAGVSVAAVAGSEHFPTHSNPGALYAALERFLRETAA